MHRSCSVLVGSAFATLALILSSFAASPALAGGQGACCFPDGSCAVLDQITCEELGGDYQEGGASTCDPNPCIAATGACCHVDGTCDLMVEAECIDHDDIFQGVGTTCDPSPCAKAGACCEGEECELFTEDHCEEHGGVYSGDGVLCDPNPCAATPEENQTWGTIKARYR